MLQKVLFWLKPQYLMNLLSQDYLAHDQGQRRLGLVTSNKDIGASFELKRRGVDIKDNY